MTPSNKKNRSKVTLEILTFACGHRGFAFLNTFIKNFKLSVHVTGVTKKIAIKS